MKPWLQPEEVAVATSARKAQDPFGVLLLFCFVLFCFAFGGQLKERIPVNMCIEVRRPPRLMFPIGPSPWNLLF